MSHWWKIASAIRPGDRLGTFQAGSASFRPADEVLAVHTPEGADRLRVIVTTSTEFVVQATAEFYVYEPTTTQED